MSPNEYPRRILLCATGTYPQVITETLYALFTERQFYPTEIHAIGTMPAREGLLKQLRNEDSEYHDLLREFNLDGKIKFDEENIHIIATEEGVELEDILFPEEIGIAADMTVNLIRELCKDDDSCLHVSMTGGRKTLSFVVGYGLSLFARPQDILSHVLVPGGYEYNKDCFYPTQKIQTLNKWNSELNRNEIMLASAARIMLADIPLVHLRKNLPENFMTSGPYTDTVEAVQYSINNPGTLKFDLKNRQLICESTTIKIQPFPLMMMLWLADRKTQGLPGISPSQNESLVRDFLDFADDIYLRIPRAQNPRYSIETPKEFVRKFNEVRARINGAIKEAMPQGELNERFLIQASGKKGAMVYDLSTAPENIELSMGPRRRRIK